MSRKGEGLAEEYAGVLPSYHELEFLGAELSRRGPALKIDAAQPDHATKTVTNKVLMKGLQTLSRFYAFTLYAAAIVRGLFCCCCFGRTS